MLTIRAVFRRLFRFAPLAVLLLATSGCGSSWAEIVHEYVNEISDSIKVDTTVNTGNKCEFGAKALLCWWGHLENPSVSVDVDHSTEIMDLLPSGDEPGRIDGLVVEGRFEADIIGEVSSTIGAGPPTCALGPWISAAAGKTVADFKITGNYEWVFGKRSNALIRTSNLSIPVFDIHNVFDKADDTIKKFVRNSIKSTVDRLVVREINKVLEPLASKFGPEDLDSLPVYESSGEGPHSVSGICN